MWSSMCYGMVLYGMKYGMVCGMLYGMLCGMVWWLIVVVVGAGIGGASNKNKQKGVSGLEYFGNLFTFASAMSGRGAVETKQLNAVGLYY